MPRSSGRSVVGHKYLYRIGAPGSYHYVYAMPDGKRVVGPDDPTNYKLAQREHTTRLLAGKQGRGNTHAMNNEQIATHVGMSAGSVRAADANFGREGRTPDVLPKHQKEAVHADPGGAEYYAHNASDSGIDHAADVQSHQASHLASRTSESAPAAPATPAARARTPEEDAASIARAEHAARVRAPSDRPDDARPIGSRTQRPEDTHAPAAAPATPSTPAPTPSAAPPTPSAPAAETKAQKEARLIAKLAKLGHRIAPIHGNPEENHTAVNASVNRAAPVSTVESPRTPVSSADVQAARNAPHDIRRSFALVVDPDEDYNFGETILKSMPKITDIKKSSSRIEKIRSILRERVS